MGSSLRNVVKRRTHKERSQPQHRAKYGLLEKKKDYVLRARDFHRKQEALDRLRRKAEERNPDEFYFAMQRAKTDRGVHVARSRDAKANAYSKEELALMRSQDQGYLSLKAQVERLAAERERDALGGVIGALAGEGDGGESDGFRPGRGLGRNSQSSGPSSARHIVFVDDDDEAKAFDAASFFQTPKQLLSKTENRPRVAQTEERNQEEEEEEEEEEGESEGEGEGASPEAGRGKVASAAPSAAPSGRLPTFLTTQGVPTAFSEPALFPGAAPAPSSSSPPALAPSELTALPSLAESSEEAERRARRLERKRRALAERLERARRLERLAAEAAYNRQVAGKGAKRKVAGREGEGRPAVYKWKAERKR